MTSAVNELHLVPVCIFEFFLGVTKCEPGIAIGAFDLNTRGTGRSVTMWPNPMRQMRKLPALHFRGVPYWQQEMGLLEKEYAPISARRKAMDVWRKLWAAVEAIPEGEAIAEEDERGNKRGLRRSLDAIQTHRKGRLKVAALNSAFCAQEFHSWCKQVDCVCVCHGGAQ